MSDSFKRLVATIPKTFRPEFNPILKALLEAIAESDDAVAAAIQEARKDMFVKTATGRPLDILGNSRGVRRPPGLGLSDEDYRRLIPNLSLKPKNIRKAFYDTADVFWGESFSRVNITSDNFAPFNVSVGDVISVRIDHGLVKNVKVLTGDIALNGAATASEIVAILSRIPGTTTTIRVDSLTDNEFINLRTNTPGPTGHIEILSSTMIGPTKLDFNVGSYDILNLDQRVAVYNIDANTLLIEIPAIVPALRRTLRGSHHFHTDATIEPPKPPDNGIWQGSFLFDPSGSQSSFTITGQNCALQQLIAKGQVYTSIAVDDTTSFQNQSGQVIFGFGTTRQEGPVRYRGIPNSNTILIDPSYTFKFDHAMNESINVISKQEPFVPNQDGSDLAIYLTSPSGARDIVQEILKSLAAAGIIVNFVILSPKYKYLLDNPYISDDDASST